MIIFRLSFSVLNPLEPDQKARLFSNRKKYYYLQHTEDNNLIERDEGEKERGPAHMIIVLTTDDR